MFHTTRLRIFIPLVALLGLLPLGFTGDTARAQEKKEAKKEKASLTILLPDTYEYEPTELKVNGKVVKLTGTKRKYVTKALEAGKEFTYKVQALIQPNNYTKITRIRNVKVKAGSNLTVDMRKDDPKSPDRVVIRWVPTPKDIVLAMGKLGKIGKDDIVYDLGCGDGVMIITAVKEMKAKKGVGIDINPTRVREAKAAAKKAGIADRIDIRKGDLLKLDSKDIGDANVVLLYMGDEMNIRIRPLLWKSLKPGTRIVSHRFTMGDWKPNRSIKVKGEDGDDYDLHLWIITGKEGKTEKKEKKKE